MKKLLFLSVCLMTLPALAQKVGECALTPLQNLIVNARGSEEVQALIDRGRVFDDPVRCGGSLMQLAIRRGNPAVLQAILNQNNKRANGIVSLEAFPIVGAPKQIPLILFAAYYAPNAEIMTLLVNNGADITATDEFGRNLLWYMNKNPVLRNTELEDELNKALLYGRTVVTTTQDASAGQPSTPGASLPAAGTGLSSWALPTTPDSTLVQENN